MILTINDPRVFEEIARGRKRFEGRREKEELLRLRPGEIIIFFLEGTLDLVVARVREVRRFETVEQMVAELWRDLVPFARSREEAMDVYKRYYSPRDPAVAIGIERVHVERIRDPKVLKKILGVDVRRELLAREKFLPEALK